MAPMLSGHQVNASALAIKEFIDRINGYLALQKKMESSLKQEPTDDPAQIESRRRALADAIRSARQNARPGEIFGAAGKLFHDVIKQDARERSIRDAFAAMQEVPRQSAPRVNVEYPKTAALATLPPLILKRLPPLADGIEYRFMGRDLILRDAHANLIVDVVHEAVPTIRR